MPWQDNKVVMRMETTMLFSPPPIALGPEDIQLRHAVQVEQGDLFQALKAKVITQFERAYIHDLLREHGGNISRAATAAGKNRRAFWELMRKHHISTQSQSCGYASSQRNEVLGRTTLS